jgi:hypothetical protein
MYRNLVITLVFASFTLTSLAQELKDSTAVEERFSVFIPKLLVETPIKPSWTVTVGAGTGLSRAYDEDTEKSYFLLLPFAEGGTRWYYNLNRRLRNNKPVAGFSGNFIGLVGRAGYAFYLGEALTDPGVFYTAGTVWGIQRNFGKNAYACFYAGPAAIYSKNIYNQGMWRFSIFGASNFEIGFRL